MDETRLMQIVAKNVERHMADRGLNAIQLSEKAGLGRNVVYDLIKMKNVGPRLHTLESLARALDVSVGELLIEPSPNEFKQRLASRIEGLPPEARERALALLDFLIAESRQKDT